MLSHPLGRIKLLRPLLNIGPFPSPGDGTTINTGFYRHSSPYAHTVVLRYGSSSMSASGNSQVLFLRPANPAASFHPITAIKRRFGAQGVTLRLEPRTSKRHSKVDYFWRHPRSHFLDCYLRKPYKKPSPRTSWNS